MQSRITELDPPRRLAFTWGEGGGNVSFDLEPKGDQVLSQSQETFWDGWTRLRAEYERRIPG